MSVENLQGEIWKDIVIDSEVYPHRISNIGRVKLLNYRKTGKERLLKQFKDKDGYLKVTLCYKGEKKQFFVHRLLAIVYLENPLNLPCINHKIEGKEGKSMNFVFFKTNGEVDEERTSIEWCDYKYNTNYGTCIERILETKKSSLAVKEGYKKSGLKKRRKVYQYDKNYQLINIYPSTPEAAKQTGFQSSSIRAACRGDKKSYKNFIWSYSPLECFQLTLFPLTEKKIS